jgi:hypothetical protein
MKATFFDERYEFVVEQLGHCAANVFLSKPWHCDKRVSKTGM